MLSVYLGTFETKDEAKAAIPSDIYEARIVPNDFEGGYDMFLERIDGEQFTHKETDQLIGFNDGWQAAKEFLKGKK